MLSFPAFNHIGGENYTRPSMCISWPCSWWLIGSRNLGELDPRSVLAINGRAKNWRKLTLTPKTGRLRSCTQPSWPSGRFRPKIAADVLFLRCPNNVYSIFVAITAKKQIEERERTNGTRTLKLGSRTCNVFPIPGSLSIRWRDSSHHSRR